MRLSFVSVVSAMIINGGMLAMPAYADITIGYIGPATGPVAAYGIQASNGVMAAVRDINKNGGINGQKLVLKMFDDAADPKQGVSVANQLAGEGILYVVGPVTSNSALPVSNVLSENGILMVTPSSTTPELSARGLWNIFRTIGRDDQQASYAAEYVLKHLRGKRIAILHDKATYGKGLADAFRSVLNKNDIDEVYYGSINPGEKDYGVIINRLKSAKADYVYFGGYHPEAGLLLRQMREQSLPAVMIGGDGLNTSELVAIAADAAEGTMFTSPVDHSDDPVAKASFNVLAQDKIPAEAFTIGGYAAVQVVAYGISKAEDADDPEEVARIIKSGEAIPTILGHITYGERGDMTSKVFSLSGICCALFHLLGCNERVQIGHCRRSLLLPGAV